MKAPKSYDSRNSGGHVSALLQRSKAALHLVNTVPFPHLDPLLDGVEDVPLLGGDLLADLDVPLQGRAEERPRARRAGQEVGVHRLVGRGRGRQHAVGGREGDGDVGDGGGGGGDDIVLGVQLVAGVDGDVLVGAGKLRNINTRIVIPFFLNARCTKNMSLVLSALWRMSFMERW